MMYYDDLRNYEINRKTFVFIPWDFTRTPEVSIFMPEDKHFYRRQKKRIAKKNILMPAAYIFAFAVFNF